MWKELFEIMVVGVYYIMHEYWTRELRTLLMFIENYAMKKICKKEVVFCLRSLWQKLVICEWTFWGATQTLIWCKAQVTYQAQV